jgi:anti-anti-sigma regulatory factor
MTEMIDGQTRGKGSMTDCTIAREWEGGRVLLRLSGGFDRATAWKLRDHVERESAPEIVVDFSLVREFSDLAVAVLAHGMQAAQRRIFFRGLRQHQMRIFRYCGLPVEEASAGEGAAPRPVLEAGAQGA